MTASVPDRDARTVAAPAKLNLYLHLTGSRPDGYHTLDSLIAFAELADSVTVRAAPAGTFALSVTGPFAGALTGPGAGPGSGEDNLAVRAARALDAYARRTGTDRRGCEIALAKNIPVAAGLGGGSADAAATLLALARLWGLDDAPLAEIGLALGADVPVCLAARPSRVTGIGENVAAAPALPESGLVLVNPRVAVETHAVFRAFDRRPSPRRPAPDLSDRFGPERFGDARDLLRALAGTGNDLTEAACGLAPVIGEVLAALEGTPGCGLARMAGSGATCFSLYDDVDAAAAAARTLRRARPGWWVWWGSWGGRT